MFAQASCANVGDSVLPMLAASARALVELDLSCTYITGMPRGRLHELASCLRLQTLCLAGVRFLCCQSFVYVCI